MPTLLAARKPQKSKQKPKPLIAEIRHKEVRYAKVISKVRVSGVLYQTVQCDCGRQVNTRRDRRVKCRHCGRIYRLPGFVDGRFRPSDDDLDAGDATTAD